MEDLDIIIIAGQSNAVGCTYVNTLDENKRFYFAPHVYLYEEGNFADYYTKRIIKGITCNMGNCDFQMGIEYGISYVLNKEFPKTTIGLIRYAYGGTTLYNHWKTDYVGEPEGSEDYGTCYYHFKKTIINGIEAYKRAGYNPTIRGMVWMQGETDAVDKKKAACYKENLEILLKEFREFLRIPDLKIIVGEIATQAPSAPYSNEVRRIQREVCGENINNIFMSTKGIKIGHDTYHFDGNEDFILGKRFGKQVVKLLTGNQSGRK